MAIELKRPPKNPIVTPGIYDWRDVVTFNPSVILDDGVFYMLERACSSLTPLTCHVGLLRSNDGVAFEHVVDHPVFGPNDLGTPQGTVEDPRVVKIDDQYLMTYVHRNYVASCYPTGKGIPVYHDADNVPEDDPNNYRSGIAVSKDLITWTNLGLVTGEDLDDRDCVLFPSKIGGRYAMLRRPMNYVGPDYGCDGPSIWISYSDDLLQWSEPSLVASPQNTDWEGGKIGAAAPPVLTDEGWLALYHGVDKDIVYRTGAMILDKEDPTKVIARTTDFIMEPTEYYEKVGLIIRRVVFPTANVVKDGTVYVYYGCADTCISVAMVGLDDLVAHVLSDGK